MQETTIYWLVLKIDNHMMTQRNFENLFVNHYYMFHADMYHILGGNMQ